MKDQQLEVHFATLDEDEIGNELMHKVAMYYDEISEMGLLDLWQKSYDAYYKGIGHGGKLNSSGEQGEYTNININHYRSLLEHKVSLTIKQRPTFEPRATNTDHKSQAQTILARGLLDYYLREKRLERVLKRAVEYSLRYGEGFIRTEWDADMGDARVEIPDNVMSDEEFESNRKEGDIRYEAFTPIDVIRDVTKESAEDNDWYIVRTFRNRFDLIAKFANIETADLSEEEMEFEDDISDEIEKLRLQILSIPSKTDDEKDGRITAFNRKETDDVAVYEFYHKKTAAVPNGRFTMFLDEQTILMDGELPYDNIPVYDMIPSGIDGTPFGYTVAYDLLQLQEAIDALHSAIITNQKTFAVQLITIPKGSNISDAAIGEGLSIIYYDPTNAPGGGKPEALNLLSTPREVFEYVAMLESMMETLSGINSVTRGNPEASLKSGAALALVQSMAIEFSMNLQQSYVALLEDVGTATINILKEFADSQRVARIVGISNKSYIQEFTGADLSEINRVTIDVGSPLSRTTAGKLQILEGMQQAGLIKTQEQYLQVLQTGQLEPAIEGQTAELMLIRSENEKLGEGNEEIVAIATDAHQMHIMEHKAVLASPESRENGDIVAATLAHIQDHIALLGSTDPNLLAMLGQQAIAPVMPPGMEGTEGMPTEGAPGVMDASEVQNIGDPGMPDMPSMPVNPMSGEEYNPDTGGL